MTKYTLADIKKAAFNMTELPGLSPRLGSLWQGLAYCYEYARLHPDETEECKQLAQKYIDMFWGDDI